MRLTRTALRKNHNLPFRHISSHHLYNASLFPLETTCRTANAHATVPATIQDPATRVEKLIDSDAREGTVKRKKEAQRKGRKDGKRESWNSDVTTILDSYASPK